jgi:membrane protein DedA with SNARE-associated domain
VRVLLASLVNVAKDIGLPALFAFIAVETMGVPLPGETALITAGVLASQGHLPIEGVIAAAAAGAIVGDNVGFAIGRRWGRRLLAWRGGPFARQRRRLLEIGEPFFDRHGPKAVFLGRWISGLRITASWLAGANRMSWPTFTFWNAAGGIAWALSVGLAAYYAGHAAETAFRTAGIAGLGGAGALGCALYAAARLRRRRAERIVEAQLDARPADGAAEARPEPAPAEPR